MLDADKLGDIVFSSLRTAVEAVSILKLNRFEAETRQKTAALGMVANIPKYRTLRLGHAAAVWTGILFVDLRGSTKRAEEIGARDTYLTMHALLPALAHLVGEADGFVVGFRGDGLFACFGIDEDGNNPADLDEGDTKGRVVQTASRCGQAMVEALEKVVNPALEMFQVKGDLRVGIGVDAGQVIITRVGLPLSHELTAYGNAVNRASKLAASSEGYSHLSNHAWDLFPKSPGGRVKPVPTSSGHRVRYPGPVLEGQWALAQLLVKG